MQIFVKSDLTRVLDVTPATSMAEISALVEEHFGVPACRQYLRTTSGSILEARMHDKTLAQCGIMHGDQLHVGGRLLGGIKNPSKIGNKMKREKVYAQYKELKKAEKRKCDLKRQKKWKH